jgi:sortase (surface protein transpeptidase)
MESTTRNARALRAAPILVLAFLMAGGGAAPAPTAVAPNPDAAQVLAAATAAPADPTARPNAVVPPKHELDRSSRRIAELDAEATAQAAAEARQEARAEARAKARAEARAEARAQAKADARNSGPTFAGTNHFWIPSLGMSYKVHAFPCSRSRPPDNYMYRWYCAGENNVYIMGHAYSVMEPLHDLYVSGGLRKGMVAVYANGSGKVTKYKVVSWRVVDPVDSHWAIADQPVPSMTLQTCVGKKSQWRLNVRLVAVG